MNTDPFKGLFASLDQQLALRETPFDPELMKQAEATCGYDLQAVSGEYNRLVLMKYHTARVESEGQPLLRRSLWSRIFGK